MIAAMVKSCTVNTSKKRRQAIIQAPRNTKKGGKAKKNAKKLQMKKNRKPNQPRQLVIMEEAKESKTLGLVLF